MPLPVPIGQCPFPSLPLLRICEINLINLFGANNYNAEVLSSDRIVEIRDFLPKFEVCMR